MAALLLSAAACGGPANSGLFSAGGAMLIGTGAGSGGSGSSSSNAGSDSGTAGSSAGGSAGTPPGEAGGAPNGGSVDTAGSSASGGGGGAEGGMLGGCSAFGSDATYYSGTQHCYLVVKALATFADANIHCSSVGAHLVTLTSQQENDFVWSLDENDHWIGATDGKGPKENTPGTYSWVDGEPFTYTHWSAEQPNASLTTCSASDGGGNCYEHCGFQWSGGDVPGEWNDRLCTNLIEAVCEWDD